MVANRGRAFFGVCDFGCTHFFEEEKLKMKKILSAVLVFVLMFSISACGKNNKEYENLSIDKTEIELLVGNTYTYTITDSDEKIEVKDFVWQSSNTDIATVSEGTVTAIKEGTSIITAVINNKVLTSTVTVKAETQAESKPETTSEPQTTSKPQTASKPQTPSSTTSKPQTASQPTTPTPAPQPTTKTYSKQEVQSLIQILDINTKLNSVGGAELDLVWKNMSDKTIKYITFTMMPYNAVGDLVKCEIRDTSIANCKVTGPIEKTTFENRDVAFRIDTDTGFFTYYFPNLDDPEKFDLTKFGRLDSWDPLWYNNTVETAKCTNIKIEYMDGSVIELNEQSSQYAIW